jgi:hypothetical protein
MDGSSVPSQVLPLPGGSCFAHDCLLGGNSLTVGGQVGIQRPGVLDLIQEPFESSSLPIIKQKVQKLKKCQKRNTKIWVSYGESAVMILRLRTAA